jgi:hypothetical protein
LPASILERSSPGMDEMINACMHLPGGYVPSVGHDRWLFFHIAW